MDETTFKQFLADVMTAAGLVAHGKRCKALSESLASRATELYAAPMPPSVPEITDEMVSAYLAEQAATVQAVDDMWGNGGKAPSYMHPVREACRAGLKAALLAAAPKPGDKA